MSHKPGTHLDGVRDLESLRMRCVCKPADGGDCWHFRTGRGRVPQKGRTMRVWSTLHQTSMSVRKLTMLMAGRGVRSDECVVDTCGCADCVNPAHLLVVSRTKAVQQAKSAGKFRTARKSIANKVAGLKRSRVSLEMRAALLASPLSAVAAGRLHGISASWVSVLRKRARDEVGVVGAA